MKRRRRLSGLVSGVLRVALRRRPRTAGVILAAGSGTRMGGEVPKQFLPVCGVPILIRSVRAFDACPVVDEIVIVTRETDIEAVKALCAEYQISGKLKAVVAGGDTRQKSAFLGVEATAKPCRYVAIHDAARCLVTPDVIRSVVETAYRRRCATAAYPVTDTLVASWHVGSSRRSNLCSSALAGEFFTTKVTWDAFVIILLDCDKHLL